MLQILRIYRVNNICFLVLSHFSSICMSIGVIFWKLSCGPMKVVDDTGRWSPHTPQTYRKCGIFGLSDPQNVKYIKSSARDTSLDIQIVQFPVKTKTYPITLRIMFRKGCKAPCEFLYITTTGNFSTSE